MSSRLLTAEARAPRLRGLHQSRRSTRLQRATTAALLDATLNARPAVYAVWIVLTLLVLSRCTCSRRRSWRRPRTRASSSASSTRRPTRRIEQTVKYADKVEADVPRASPRSSTPSSSRSRPSGFGGGVLKPWDERKRTAFADPAGGCSRSSPRSPGSASSRCAAGAAQRRLVPGRVRHRLDRRAGADPASSPKQLQQKAADRAAVRVPADHRHEARPAADRDRHRPRQGRVAGAEHAAGRRRLSAMLGGNFVNRFNIDGRSYKVIPQIERAGAADARPAPATSTSPAPTGSSSRLSTIATLARTRPSRARSTASSS